MAQACFRGKGDPNCPYHLGKKIILQCEDCPGSLICQSCITSNHEGHTFKELDYCLQDRIRKLQSFLKDAETKRIPKAAKDIELSKTKVKENKQRYTADMKLMREQGERLKEQVDTITAQRISTLESLLKNDTDALSSYTAELETFQENLASLTKDCKNAVKSQNDIFIIDTEAETEENVQKNPDEPKLTTWKYLPCKSPQSLVDKAFGEIDISNTKDKCNSKKFDKTGKRKESARKKTNEATGGSESPPTTRSKIKSKSKHNRTAYKTTPQSVSHKCAPYSSSNSSAQDSDNDSYKYSESSDEKSNVASKRFELPTPRIHCSNEYEQSSDSDSGSGPEMSVNTSRLLDCPFTLSTFKTSFTARSICLQSSKTAWICPTEGYEMEFVDYKGTVTQKPKFHTKFRSICLHATSRKLYGCCREEQTVRMFNTHRVSSTKVLSTANNPQCLPFSMAISGNWLVVGMTGLVWICTLSGEVRRSIPCGLNFTPYHISLCSQSGRIALSGGSGGVKVVDGYGDRGEELLYTYHKPKCTYTGIKGLIAYCAVFDNNGCLLVADRDNTEIHIVNAATGEPLGSIKTNEMSRVWSLALHENGVLWVGCEKPDQIIRLRYTKH